MQTHYLLGKIIETTKESRLVFLEKPADLPASATATGLPEHATKTEAPTDNITPGSGKKGEVEKKPEGEKNPDGTPKTTEVPRNPEKLNPYLKAGAIELKAQADAILKQKEGTYTAAFTAGAKEVSAKMGEMITVLSQPDWLNKIKNPEELFAKFQEAVKTMYPAASLELNAAAMASIKETKAALETAKERISPDFIWNEVFTNNSEMGKVPPAVGVALKEKYGADAKVKAIVDAVTTLLDEADKSVDPAAIKAKIAEAKDKLTKLTIEAFADELPEFANKYKDITKAVEALSKLGGDGKYCKVAKEKMATEVAANIKDKGDMTADMIKQEYEQDILMGHVADVINLPEVTPENIKTAIRSYELGLAEPGKETDAAKKIIDALVANKDALKKAGVKMDFLGSTDGTDHKLIKAPDYHTAKAAALSKLLAFSDAGKLTTTPAGGIDLAAGSATRGLIEQYIKETAAGKGYEFIKAHQSEFLTGGKIFDAALALQRAEDMKKRVGVEGFALDKDGKVLATESGLTIELGTTNVKTDSAKAATERNSGITFSAVEVDKKPDDKEFQGKYTDKPFRDEIKKGAPNATDQEIENKTQEVYFERKNGKPLPEDRATPDFKAEVIKRLTTPANKPAEHPDDKDQDKVDRAYYEGKGIRYVTRAEAVKDPNMETTPEGKIKPKTGFTWLVSPADVASKYEGHENFAIKSSAAEYEYKLGTDGKTLSFETNAGTASYTIDNPDGAKLTVETSKTNEGDKIIGVELKGAKAYFEFNPTDGKFMPPGKRDGAEDLNKTYDIKCENNVISIKAKNITPPAPNQTPVEPPAAPTGTTQEPVNPPAAPTATTGETLDTNVKALNETIGTAKASVEAKMKAVEDVIDKDESWPKKGIAQDKMAAAKADMKATFAQVKGLLGEAETLGKAGKVPEAKAKYAEAETVLDKKLKSAQKKDDLEGALASTTQQKIKELRDEIAVQKPKVEAAFDKLKKKE